jgi:hypothetical protein
MSWVSSPDPLRSKTTVTLLTSVPVCHQPVSSTELSEILAGPLCSGRPIMLLICQPTNSTPTYYMPPFLPFTAAFHTSATATVNPTPPPPQVSQSRDDPSRSTPAACTAAQTSPPPCTCRQHQDSAHTHTNWLHRFE